VRARQRVGDRWYPSTALDDLLGIEEGKINDTRLYRCLDQILKLERHLKQRYGELFGAEFDVLLYDLTSTYVEGAARSAALLRAGGNNGGTVPSGPTISEVRRSHDSVLWARSNPNWLKS
jgi:hypothetical protein